MNEWMITSDTQNHIPAEDIKRVKELKTETTDLIREASPELRKKLLTHMVDSRNDFFHALSSEIGEAEARNHYAVHLVIGSTPPANMKSFDYSGRGEAELRRVCEYFRDAVANEKNGM